MASASAGLADICLILPAFNERDVILSSISEATAYFQGRGLRYEIIVAADGTDGTRELVREAAAGSPFIRVIGSPERRGKGRGIREGVTCSNAAIVGFADADNKVPITELDKILPWLQQGYDLVIGSRTMAESAIDRRQPLYRRVGSRCFSLLYPLLVGLPGITDTQCGFKFFSRAAALELFGRQKIDGYMVDIEILALACHLGMRLRQVPIRWRDDHDSRLGVRGALQDIVELVRIRSLVRELRRSRQ